MPTSAELELVLAELHLDQGRVELALAAADEAGARDPGLVGVQLVRGLAQIQLGHDDEAADSLSAYLNRAGNHWGNDLASGLLRRHIDRPL